MHCRQIDVNYIRRAMELAKAANQLKIAEILQKALNQIYEQASKRKPNKRAQFIGQCMRGETTGTKETMKECSDLYKKKEGKPAESARKRNPVR